jgi:excisionase family DNA binding protein
VRRALAEIPPVMTLKDLAEYLKVHPSTIYRLLKTGQLHGFKVGSDWRFNREHVDRWLFELQNKPEL